MTAQGSSPGASAKTHFDAVIIGAGFSGMYMLHSLRDKLDLNVTVFEAGDGVGGTWYWNRYPGARCDSDSYIYCYTFDKNLLQEWTWSERYPEQDEILRYLEHCAERFDLKPDIQFGKRVVEVIFDDNTELWTVRTDKGDSVTTRFVINAVGALSTANMPPFKGWGSFKGKCYHTSQWPHDGVDFTAKRVGVIGTGATAVQAIPEIAQQAKHLTVFQRTPAWGRSRRGGRERNSDDRRQFLVHGRQHRRQGAPLLAVSRPGRRRRLSQEVRRDCRKGLRGLCIRGPRPGRNRASDRGRIT